ncbi:hypothetical protein BKM31_54225 [[Actinomadura] parvosata subsp. kistnae]|uniref:Secreted protein n=2 Tax=Nonomuraea TaxID=83681 RepID=A0A1V0AGM6_9ACTN|nr:hypothetical protein [Nonomuraea sp. ATCC 55076]AQZ69242.1 hypothetical protein BKM31_54225 [Nonomuraea sp. ATCC 55076]
MVRRSHMAAVAAGAALALVPAGLPAPAAAAATVLRCDTFVHANDNDLGIAACSNPTGQTWIFRAVVVCGRAPDVVGEWVTLPPGGYGESQGYCGGIFTSGVGAVGVDERPA